ncbi:hypothetical protein KY304_02250, partial [Candidatus Woesearchaeota archaeon]|nr:hypothetical protein [Candidatus Woesearchaeota archaeon]
MGWPVCFEHNLRIGSPESNVGICTLWSEKDSIISRISKEYYAILGNLYSQKGIEYLIRNTLANPRIRYIVIFGQDMANSGEKLIKLVKGDNLDINIDDKFLDIFRKQIKVF